MTKPVYRYCHETGVYLGSQEARISPLEPDVYLLPAYCTFDVPPKKQANKVQAFIDGKWVHIPDHRGKDCWDIETHEKKTVEAAGELPENITLFEPEFGALSKWDGAKWIEDADKKKTARIIELKANLNSTDYKFTADYDQASGDEWEALKTQRQAWRDEIRELQQ